MTASPSVCRETTVHYTNFIFHVSVFPSRPRLSMWHPYKHADSLLVLFASSHNAHSLYTRLTPPKAHHAIVSLIKSKTFLLWCSLVFPSSECCGHEWASHTIQEWRTQVTHGAIVPTRAALFSHKRVCNLIWLINHLGYANVLYKSVCF